jgi:hypothetical protein
MSATMLYRIRNSLYDDFSACMYWYSRLCTNDWLVEYPLKAGDRSVSRSALCVVIPFILQDATEGEA